MHESGVFFNHKAESRKSADLLFIVFFFCKNGKNNSAGKSYCKIEMS